MCGLDNKCCMSFDGLLLIALQDSVHDSLHCRSSFKCSLEILFSR